MSEDLRGNMLLVNRYLGTTFLKLAVKLADLHGIPYV